MIKPKNEIGPTMRRGDRDAQRHTQQQAADAPVIVHAQIDGLLLAQGEHVQQGQLLAAATKMSSASSTSGEDNRSRN